MRRNRALRLASYRCATCGARRGLEVHHVTYERLGAERDDDLRVLCAACHHGWHREQLATRLHLKIVRVVIGAEPTGATVADLMEAAKALCGKERLPYDTERLGRAFDLVQESWRRRPRPARRRELPPHVVAVTVRDARAIWGKLAALDASAMIKTMPTADTVLSETDYNARLQELREQAEVIQRGPRPRRRPIAERLAAIFDTDGGPQ